MTTAAPSISTLPLVSSSSTTTTTTTTSSTTSTLPVISSGGINNPTNSKLGKRKAFRDAMRQRQGLAQQQAQGLRNLTQEGETLVLLLHMTIVHIAHDYIWSHYFLSNVILVVDVAPALGTELGSEFGSGSESMAGSGSGSGQDVPKELLSLLKDPDSSITTAKLRLVHAYRQVLSPTFSRWLCVIEKT